MDQLKYIVGESGDFAIFSPTAKHSDVARQMMGKPAGAGFIQISMSEGHAPIISCYGESITIGIKSRYDIDAGYIFSGLFIDDNT